MHAKATIKKSFALDGKSGSDMRVDAMNKRRIPAYVDGIDINLRAAISHLVLLPGGFCDFMCVSYLSPCINNSHIKSKSISLEDFV